MLAGVTAVDTTPTAGWQESAGNGDRLASSAPNRAEKSPYA